MVNGTSKKACTIGHFDGVHVGHQYVIRRMLAESAKRGIADTMVFTFDRLPRTLFDPTFRPLMLTTIEERKARLLALGVGSVEVLTFDRAMASQSAHDFMEHVLRDRFSVRLLVLGYDNRFGKLNPDETFDDYVRYGEELGIEVVRCDRYEVEGIGAISSTKIRQMIADGNEEQAKQLMR